MFVFFVCIVSDRNVLFGVIIMVVFVDVLGLGKKVYSEGFVIL